MVSAITTIVITVLIVIAVYQISVQIQQQQQNLGEVQGGIAGSFCRDSDNGNSIYSQGQCVSARNSGTDKCNADGTLTEYYCSKGKGNLQCLSSIATCPAGYPCSNGACVPIAGGTISTTTTSTSTTSQTTTISPTPSSYTISISGSTVYSTDSNGNVVFSGTDATQVIQNAINSLGNSGGKIFINAGTYNVTQIIVNKSNVVIDSNSAVLFAVDNNIKLRSFVSSKIQNGVQSTEALSSAPVVLLDKVTNVTIKNVIVDGNPMKRTFFRDGVLVWDSTNVLLEKCQVRNTEGNAIRIRSSGTYNQDNPQASVLNNNAITVNNCFVNKTVTVNATKLIKGFGYEVEFSQNVLVENSFADKTQESMYRTHYARLINFVNNTGGIIDRVTSGETFDIYHSDSIIIRGNKIHDYNGIYIYQYVRNLLAEQNVMDFNNPSYTMVRLKATTGYETNPISNIYFRNNSISGTVQLSNSYLKNVSFNNNKLYSLYTNIINATLIEYNNISFTHNVFTATNSNNAIVRIPINFFANSFLNRVEVRNSTANVTLDSNNFSSDGVNYAVGVYVAGSVPHLIIKNNYFHDITYQAIYANIANGSGLGQNQLIEIFNNHFKHNGFVGPQDTVLFKNNTVQRMNIINNTFELTAGTYSMKLYNTCGTLSSNTMDKPISWQPSSTC